MKDRITDSHFFTLSHRHNMMNTVIFLNFTHVAILYMYYLTHHISKLYSLGNSFPVNLGKSEVEVVQVQHLKRHGKVCKKTIVH